MSRRPPHWKSINPHRSDWELEWDSDHANHQDGEIAMTKMTTIPLNYNNIRAEIVDLLKPYRSAASLSVNAGMTPTYWEIGRRIVQSEQAGEKRAEYGDVLIQRLAKDLSALFGRGFGSRNLAQMRSFYLAWPYDKILQTLSAKSSIPIALNEIQGESQPVHIFASHQVEVSQST